jgi:hypothetical protein
MQFKESELVAYKLELEELKQEFETNKRQLQHTVSQLEQERKKHSIDINQAVMKIAELQRKYPTGFQDEFYADTWQNNTLRNNDFYVPRMIAVGGVDETDCAVGSKAPIVGGTRVGNSDAAAAAGHASVIRNRSSPSHDVADGGLQGRAGMKTAGSSPRHSPERNLMDLDADGSYSWRRGSHQ